MKAWLKTHRSVAASVLLMAVVVSLSLGLMDHIYRVEEELCFQELQSATGELTNEIRLRVESDQQLLAVIADVIAAQEEQDPAEVVRVLRQYHSRGMMTRLQVLYPDDTLLLSTGERIAASGLLSFEEEAALGTHISGKETDPTSGQPVLRNYVPIVRDGETAALLCGVVELTRLPELWSTAEFGGSASAYVIDGATGEFLMDTWHQTLGTIDDLGRRTMKEGFSPEQFGEDIRGGVPGYVAFISRTVGDYLFLYYTPAGINRWMVALSVPEGVVYQRADQIRSAFLGFLAVEGVCFLLYLAWVLRSVRRETREKQKRLDLVSYIYDVEKLLFTAHQNPEQMDKALARVAGMNAARSAFFETAWDDGERAVYLWRRPEPGAGGPPPATEELSYLELFRQGRGPVRAWSEAEAAQAGEEIRRVFRRDHLRNLMVVPVESPSGDVIGALGVADTAVRWESSELLGSVAFSFSMFHRNSQSYRLVKKMGEVDALTGLRNRNSFQRDLELYQRFQGRSLACAYLDADGLHELNNQQGHAAGDRMLQFVAQHIQAEFGGDTTYRIGGDEFLAFALDMDPETVVRKSQAVAQAAEREGYHVSVGIQWRAGTAPVEAVMEEAEQRMYAEKARYYARQGGERAARQP